MLLVTPQVAPPHYFAQHSQHPSPPIDSLKMAPIKPREPKNTVQEDRICRALEEWQLEGTSFRKLAVKYGVSSSTLSDQEHGGLTRQEGHTYLQKLTPTMEKALEDWCKILHD